MQKNKEQTILKQIISVFFKKTGVFSLAIIIMLIQAKALGAEGRGLLAAILVLPNLFVIIAEGGMRQATTYFLGKELVSKSEVINTSNVFFFFSAIVFTALLYFFQSYTMPELDNQLLFWSILGVPFLVVNSGYRGVLLGFKKTKEFGNNLLIPKLCQTLLVSITFVIGFFDIYYAVAIFSIYCISNALLGYFSINKLSGALNFRHFNFALLVKMLKLGFIFGLSFFFINLNYQVGILVGKQELSPFELGNYALTLQIAELVWQLPAAISVVFFSESMSKKVHDDEWVATITKTSRVQIVLTAIMCIVAIPCAKYILPAIVGDDYVLVYKILLYMTPGIVMMSVFKVINVDFAGRGKAWISLTFMPIIAFFNYILSIKLASVMGVNGLAISVSLSYVFAALLAVIVYSYLFKVNPLRFFIPKFN